MATKKANDKAAAKGDVTDVEPKSETGKTAKPASKQAEASEPAAKSPTPFLERHPLSEKFGPKMSQEELLGLATDIEQHGQHDDIILFEGKVLAGWNRYMACKQKAIEPRVKEMNPESKPLAVAFGTNFVRRRLSSIQKAYYGAKYALGSEGSKQTDVAKLVGCNLNRLNQCSQLLKRVAENPDDEEAKQAVESLENNPELSSGAFDEMMIELGIMRVATPKPKAPDAPMRSNTFAGDDDDDDLLGGDGDDLTGGAIDNILGNDEDLEPDTGKDPATRKRREVGDETPLPDVGTRSPNLKNPHETQVSRVAKAFKAMQADEQQQFVKFCWGKLQVALNGAIVAGEVQYTAPEPHEPTPEPDTAKGKRRAAKQAAKPDADEDDMLAGKQTPIGALVASVAGDAAEPDAEPTAKPAGKPAKAPAKPAGKPAKAPAKGAAAKAAKPAPAKASKGKGK